MAKWLLLLTLILTHACVTDDPLQTSQDIQFQTDLSEANDVVEADTKVPINGCNPGDTRCEEKILVGCNSLGVWVEHKVCKNACVDGHCTQCVPDQSRCSNGGVERCTKNGSHWEAKHECPHACINGACCDPKCGERHCGPDACGGQCGHCGPLEQCDSQGQCLCKVSCDGSQGCMWASSCPISKGCAIDKCGGYCGPCSEDHCLQECTKVGVKAAADFKCKPTESGIPTICALTADSQLRCVPLCFDSKAL